MSGAEIARDQGIKEELEKERVVGRGVREELEVILLRASSQTSGYAMSSIDIWVSLRTCYEMFGTDVGLAGGEEREGGPTGQYCALVSCYARAMRYSIPALHMELRTCYSTSSTGVA
eukprot:130662-Rhodomonas_salina.4